MATTIIRHEERNPTKFDVWLEDPRLRGGGMVAHRQELPDQDWADARVNDEVARQAAESDHETKKATIFDPPNIQQYTLWIQQNAADDEEVQGSLDSNIDLYIERGLF